MSEMNSQHPLLLPEAWLPYREKAEQLFADFMMGNGGVFEWRGHPELFPWLEAQRELRSEVTNVTDHLSMIYVPGMELEPDAEPMRARLEAEYWKKVREQAHKDAIRADAKRQLAAADGEAPPDRLGMTLREFLADAGSEDEQIPFTVPGVFPQRCRLLLTGEEGRGKSTLIRWFDVCHAAGVHPWTGQAYEGGTSMLLDAENPPDLLRQRLGELTTFLEHHIPGSLEKIMDRLIVESQPAGFDLSSPMWAEYLGQIIADRKPSLLGGGPIYKLSSQLARSEEAFTDISTALGRLQDQHGFAMAFETHCRQADKDGDRPDFPYGNTGWRRWPDMGYHLNSRGDLTDWRGNRYGNDAPWPLRLLRVPGSNVAWTAVHGQQQIAAGAPLVDVAAKIAQVAAVVAQQPGINQKTLRALVGGTGNQWIDAAVGAGAIAVQRGGPGKATHYYPPGAMEAQQAASGEVIGFEEMYQIACQRKKDRGR